MNMTLIDASEKFLTRATSEKGAEKIFKKYLAITDSSPKEICEHSVPYRKAFVQYPPHHCLSIMYREKNMQFSLSPWGDEYLHLLTLLAAYHLDRREFVTGLNWAIKAIHVFDYFNPTINPFLRERLLRDMVASSMVCCYPEHFNQRASDNFFLAWEVDRFYYCGHRVFFNDN